MVMRVEKSKDSLRRWDSFPGNLRYLYKLYGSPFKSIKIAVDQQADGATNHAWSLMLAWFEQRKSRADKGYHAVKKTSDTLKPCQSSSPSPTHLTSSSLHPFLASGTPPSPCDLSPFPQLFFSTLSSLLHSMSTLVVISFPLSSSLSSLFPQGGYRCIE